MSPEKPILKEVALESQAIKAARSNPIPQAQVDRGMNFIRSFILGIPTQQVRETQEVQEQPVDTGELNSIKKLAGIK